MKLTNLKLHSGKINFLGVLATDYISTYNFNFTCCSG
jgi:hypothetical protein